MKRIHILICILFCVFLAACSKKTEENHSTTKAESTSTADAAAEATNNDVTADEKLGTKWGDEIDSHVTEVDLKRKTDAPWAEAIV